MAVPLPSTSSAPPSSTRRVASSGSCALALTSSATLLSKPDCCFLPQPLKLNLTQARSPFCLRTKTGPVSRIHRSSIWAGMSTTRASSICRALSISASRTSMLTGSWAAMALAMRASASCTCGTCARDRMASEAPNAIHVALWASASSGMRQPSAEPCPAGPLPLLLSAGGRASASPASPPPQAASKLPTAIALPPAAQWRMKYRRVLIIHPLSAYRIDTEIPSASGWSHCGWIKI
ncbi:hypothetical protein D3C72_1083190 [compost metagenome]